MKQTSAQGCIRGATTTQRIALTECQLKEIEGFKDDLKADRVGFAFKGTMLECVALLEGAKGIADGFRH